jgi:hypothetical protein
MRPLIPGFPSRRRRSPMLLAVAVLVVLAACSAGASVAPGGTTGAARQPGFVGQPVPVDENGSKATAPPEADVVDLERHIVKTGDVTIEVADVVAAVDRVRAAALQLGGYVGGSQAGTASDRATLTLRVPAERFDDALAALHDLDGKVLVEATREEDVTGTVVDLRARIANLEASESQYRDLLRRAERIEDILSVQSRLDEVRGQIEQLSGQLKAVSNQADLATLTVSLTPRQKPVEEASSGWDPGSIASEALASLVEIGQAVVAVAIWFGIVWLPVLAVLALLALLVMRGLLELRRRMPAPPAPPAASAPPDAAT